MGGMSGTSICECTCECGDDLAVCRAAWDECGAVELGDPTYYAVHHLMVSSFMAQHPGRLSASGWDEVAALLARFVAGLTPEAARREVGARRREQSLVRGEPKHLDGVRWTRRISGVSRDTAEAYCADIRAWAESTVLDIAGQVPQTASSASSAPSARSA